MYIWFYQGNPSLNEVFKTHSPQTDRNIDKHVSFLKRLIPVLSYIWTILIPIPWHFKIMHAIQGLRWSNGAIWATKISFWGMFSAPAMQFEIPCNSHWDTWSVNISNLSFCWIACPPYEWFPQSSFDVCST